MFTRPAHDAHSLQNPSWTHLDAWSWVQSYQRQEPTWDFTIIHHYPSISIMFSKLNSYNTGIHWNVHLVLLSNTRRFFKVWLFCIICKIRATYLCTIVVLFSTFESWRMYLMFCFWKELTVWEGRNSLFLSKSSKRFHIRLSEIVLELPTMCISFLLFPPFLILGLIERCVIRHNNHLAGINL